MRPFRQTLSLVHPKKCKRYRNRGMLNFSTIWYFCGILKCLHLRFWKQQCSSILQPAFWIRVPAQSFSANGISASAWNRSILKHRSKPILKRAPGYRVPGSDRTGRAALSVHSDRIWNTDFEMHADSECSESLRMNSNSIEPQPYRQKEYRSYRQKEYRSFYCLIRSGNALNEFLDQALADSSFSASLQVPAQVRLETFILSLASLKIRKALIVTRSARYRISDFRSHSQEKSIQNQV